MHAAGRHLSGADQFVIQQIVVDRPALNADPEGCQIVHNVDQGRIALISNGRPFTHEVDITEVKFGVSLLSIGNGGDSHVNLVDLQGIAQPVKNHVADIHFQAHELADIANQGHIKSIERQIFVVVLEGPVIGRSANV